MGRSPVLATDSVTVLRPALSSISPSLMNNSPGIICLLLRHSGRAEREPGSSRFVTSGFRVRPFRPPPKDNSSDRLMHGDKLRAVRKCRLDLNVVDHLRDPVHALRTGQHLRAGLHQIGDGAAVARALDDEIGDDGYRLGMVELDAAIQPATRDDRGHRDQKLVLFAGRQIHASTLMIWTIWSKAT